MAHNIQRRRTLMCSVFMLQVLLLPVRTQAQPKIPSEQNASYEEAKKLFLEGVKMFDDGYYLQAITKFKDSYKAFKNPKAHARVALCYKWLGNNLKALDYYEKFLSEFPSNPTKEPDIQLRKQIQSEVDKLLLKISILVVEMQEPKDAEIQVNGQLVGRSPLRRQLRLIPGPVNVTVIAKNYYPFKRNMDLEAGKKVVVPVTLIKIPPKIITKRIIVPSTPIYKRWWFWTVVGGLVAGGATAAGVLLGFKETKRDLTGIPVYHDSLMWR